MYSNRLSNVIRATAFAFTLVFALSAIQAMAQNTSGTTTQSSPAAQSTPSGGGSQTTRETTTATTTTQTSQPAETTTGVDPIWIAVGAIALIALIAIVVMAGRKRSGPDKTVYESKTVIKKD